MAGEFAWRNQSWKRLQSEEKARQLRNLGTQLTTTVDMNDLMATLATELAALGVQRCYLSLYQDPGTSTALARLEMGFNEHGPLPLDMQERIFPACLLTPEPVWDQQTRFSLLVEPLYLRSEQFGFMVFETAGWEGAREADLWTAIQQQVSGSIKVMLLHRDAEIARREAEAGWRLAEERRQSAEEANQLKSRFLSMVSHEMRTPLNVIAGLSENLIQQSAADVLQPSGNYHRDLERIHASAQHLDSLICDVLDLAVSHVGQLKLVLERLDVAEAIAGVVDISERMAAEKGLSWRVEIPEHLPKISYDRTRLRQILLNLIGNALKFTEKGEIVLRVQREGETIHFSVRDTGLGIPPADQTLIFEEFHRSERAATRGFGGLGLGLAICRRLVELGDGRIGVHSSGEMGGGSTFYFSFPALPESSPGPLIDSGARILLLTDCAEMGSLSKQLAQKGFIVDEICIDKQKNWMDRLGEAPPGAIVMGYGSTPEVGWEAINAIKTNPSTRPIPILICSLSGDHGAILELNYLEKPIEEQQLLQALEQKGFLHDLPPRDILLIDDDLAILELHARLVERHLPGSRVRRAASGRTGLQEMRQSRPDLVLLDLMMPEVNGFDVLREMRESEELRGISIIVMTSQKLSEYEMDQLNNGVAAVLEKGLFSASETLLQLEAVLSRRKHLGSEARRLARISMVYIHEHYREPIARKDLADNARVSQEYLSTCFHHETGITLTDYIERYRIKQSKRLLETTDQPVTRIAMDVGYNDSGYFGRIFRREVGVSPLAYRKGERGQRDSGR
jgi:signal transduction histidine kinase/AraC-like DNA-binding protein